MRLPDVRLLHHRARRFARWTGSIAYRTIVVPLLDRAETEHALDLACRLAADRGARVILVAPAVLERELPLNAHLDGQLRDLKERLEFAAAVAGSYGVGVRQEIVRTRPGSLGEEVARIATERRAAASRLCVRNGCTSGYSVVIRTRPWSSTGWLST